jgi:uncharacterized protein (DUF1697 family)
MTGHNSIKMTDLLTLYKNLGYYDAESYIQSGNVVFSISDDAAGSDICINIEKAIHERFNYDIAVLIRTIEEMRKIVSVNPFLTKEKFDASKMAVLFLSEKPANSQIEKVRDINYPPDEFRIIEKEIFIYCPNGFGRTKLYTNFFERKMSVTGTARNWRTVNKLLDIAGKKLPV